MNRAVLTIAVFFIALFSFGCVSFRSTDIGRRFFNKELSREDYLNTLRPILDTALAYHISETDFLKKFRDPVRTRENSRVKVRGWFFESSSSTSWNLGVFQRTGSSLEQFILVVAFDKRGAMVDYDMAVVEMPSARAEWKTEPIGQLAVTTGAVYLLDRYLDQLLDKAGAKLEEAIRNGIRDGIPNPVKVKLE